MKSSLILTRLLTQEKKTLNINIMTKGLVTTELIYIYNTAEACDKECLKPKMY